MAFPTTSVLDNCTRANESPLSDGSQWTTGGAGVWFPASPSCQLLTDAIRGTSGFASAYWNPATYTDTEVYATLGATGGVPALLCRYTHLGSGSSNQTGYWTELTTPTSVRLIRGDTGGGSTVLATYTIATAAIGDQFGLSIVGTTITTYYKAGAGAWTALGVVTDATYASGNIGVAFDASGTTGSLTSFGGGSYVPPAVSASGMFALL